MTSADQAAAEPVQSRTVYVVVPVTITITNGAPFSDAELLECALDLAQTPRSTLAMATSWHDGLRSYVASVGEPRNEEALSRLDIPWTDELRAQLVRTYDRRYEELSAESWEDFGARGINEEMGRDEKLERALSAVLAVFRHWLRTGEVRHWTDALASWPKADAAGTPTPPATPEETAS